jgi:hypothetical protein
MAASMKMAVLWVGAIPRFLARGLLIAQMMEAASTFETSVNFYQTTRRYSRKDSYLHVRPSFAPTKKKPVQFYIF